MRRGGLGKGLEVLLPAAEVALETVIREIPIEEIDPNGEQPRKDFDKNALQQLADSIVEAGILSPILVVVNGSRYRIVAGERRYRAARVAGLDKVPCIIRDMTNDQQMAAALIENLQREDLNAIEEASAIQSLMHECGYTQETASQKLGKSRSAIANTLRLLKLPDEIRNMIINHNLTAGHARVLAGINDIEKQLRLARQCISQGWSVRRLEEAAREKKSPAKPALKTLTPELQGLQDSMRKALGLRTVLKGSEKKGKITLTYNNTTELEHLYDAIERMLEH